MDGWINGGAGVWVGVGGDMRVTGGGVVILT